VSDRVYPKPGRYFARLAPNRPLFQGDIVRGGFGAWWRHPEAVRAQLAGEPAPTDPPFPTLDALRSNVLVRGRGYGMVLPQPCDCSEGEKGASHPFRVVAPLLPLDRDAGVDHARVRTGQVGHTVWVPRWRDDGPQDFYVDLRWATGVDASFVTRDARVAALSRAAWTALADRLSRFYVGVPLDTVAFAVQQGGLHPDSSA
jgi:hypothetical protein